MSYMKLYVIATAQVITHTISIKLANLMITSPVTPPNAALILDNIPTLLTYLHTKLILNLLDDSCIVTIIDS